jgi:hypothetical protein
VYKGQGRNSFFSSPISLLCLLLLGPSADSRGILGGSEVGTLNFLLTVVQVSLAYLAVVKSVWTGDDGRDPLPSSGLEPQLPIWTRRPLLLLLVALAFCISRAKLHIRLPGPRSAAASNFRPSHIFNCLEPRGQRWAVEHCRLCRLQTCVFSFFPSSRAKPPLQLPGPRSSHVSACASVMASRSVD